MDSSHGYVFDVTIFMPALSNQLQVTYDQIDRVVQSLFTEKDLFV